MSNQETYDEFGVNTRNTFNTPPKGKAMKKSMRTYIVYAERTVLETLEVQAVSEEDALEKAIEADNSEWQTDSDIDWQITNAREQREQS